MKKVLWKHLGAVFVALFLLTASGERALAGVTDLDPMLSGWLEQEGTVRFSMSLELKTLLPFIDPQIGMMNSVLKHLSVLSSIEQDGTDSLITLALASDGGSLFTLTERESDGSFALTTTLLPNRVLTSNGLSVIDRLANETDGTNETGEADGPGFDMAVAISQAEANYSALINACEPFAEKKKANYKIKDIGTAKWSQIARLTTQQSDEMLPLLRAVLQCGMDPAHRAELSEVRFDKNFIVALYKLGENDDDLAVYMKGNLIFPDRTTAKFSYQWAFITKDGERKDTYKYELSRNTKPASSRAVVASLSQTLSNSQMKLKGNVVLTVKANRITTERQQKTDLSGKASDSSRTLQGSFSEQTKITEAGKTATTLTTLTPDLTFVTDNGDNVLSGAVKAETKADKAVTAALTFTFAKNVPADFTAITQSQGLFAVVGDAGGNSGAATSSIFQNAEEDPANDNEEPADPLSAASPGGDFLVNKAPIGMQSHVIPESIVTISMDTASASVRAEVLDELIQNLAGKLLLALMELPAEDLTLLQNGMTAEDYASFLSLFDNP